MTVYLNSSSHGQPSHHTLQRMMDYLALEQEVGVFEASRCVQNELTQVRYDAAALINAAPENLGFSSTTTTAWLSIVARLDLARGRILVAPHEWGDNLRALESIAEKDATIEVLPELDLTAPNLNKWRERIDDEVVAIFAPMVPSIDGYRYPVESIGRLPRPEGCRFIVDAAQALGQTPVDVAALSCDAVVATCRKWLRGPRNTALFWIKNSLGDRFSAAELEPFDTSLALRLGLGVAVSEAAKIGTGEIEKRVHALRDYAADAARAIGLTVQTGIPSQTGPLCLGIPTKNAAITKQKLTSRGFVVKFPNRKVHEPFAPVPEADTVLLRISPNIYNSKNDIYKFFETLEDVLKSSRASR